jgi:hypothetical protein
MVGNSSDTHYQQRKVQTAFPKLALLSQLVTLVTHMHQYSIYNVKKLPMLKGRLFNITASTVNYTAIL